MSIFNVKAISGRTVIVHGTADAIIPVSQTWDPAAAMDNRAEFAYIEVPGGDHDSPLSHVGVLDWVLSEIMGGK